MRAIQLLSISLLCIGLSACLPTPNLDRYHGTYVAQDGSRLEFDSRKIEFTSGTSRYALSPSFVSEQKNIRESLLGERSGIYLSPVYDWTRDGVVSEVHDLFWGFDRLSSIARDDSFAPIPGLWEVGIVFEAKRLAAEPPSPNHCPTTKVKVGMLRLRADLSETEDASQVPASFASDRIYTVFGKDCLLGEGYESSAVEDSLLFTRTSDLK